LRHGIKTDLVRKWIPAYRERQAPALSAFVPMKLESRTQPDQQMSVSIVVPFVQQKLTVKWPFSDPDAASEKH
jgi:transposase